MLRRRIAPLLVALAALMLPATALAQSAGDDQYTDPLAGTGGGSTSGHISNSSGSSGSGSSSSSSGPTTTTASNPSGTSPSGSSTASSSSTTTTPKTGEAASGTPKGQLPRTGFDVLISFELG